MPDGFDWEHPHEHTFEKSVSLVLNPNALNEPPLEPYSRSGLQSYRSKRIFDFVPKFDPSDLKPNIESVPDKTIVNYPEDISKKSWVLEEKANDGNDQNGSPAIFSEISDWKKLISPLSTRNLFHPGLSDKLPDVTQYRDPTYVEHDVVDLTWTEDSARTYLPREIIRCRPEAIKKTVHSMITCASYDKPLFLRALNQLAFRSSENSRQLASAPAVLPALHQALNAADETSIEALILITNMSAASSQAAERIARFDGIFDTLINLCASVSSARSLRALGALNCVTRQAKTRLTTPQITAMRAVLEHFVRLDRRDEHAMVTLLLASCIYASAMSSVQRRKWAADPRALRAAVEAVRRGLAGATLAGIWCELGTAVPCARLLACSPSNRAALVAMGLLEPTVRAMVTWTDDTGLPAREQLDLLEACLGLLLALATVPGTGPTLTALRIGPHLHQVLDRRPGEAAVRLTRFLMRVMSQSAASPLARSVPFRKGPPPIAAEGAPVAASAPFERPRVSSSTPCKSPDGSDGDEELCGSDAAGDRGVFRYRALSRPVTTGSPASEPAAAAEESKYSPPMPTCTVFSSSWSNRDTVKELLAAAGGGLLRRRTRLGAARPRGSSARQTTTVSGRLESALPWQEVRLGGLVGEEVSAGGSPGPSCSTEAMATLGGRDAAEPWQVAGGRLSSRSGVRREWAWRAGGCWRSGPMDDCSGRARERGEASLKESISLRPATSPEWNTGVSIWQTRRRAVGGLECVGLSLCGEGELDILQWSAERKKNDSRLQSNCIVTPCSAHRPCAQAEGII